MVMNFPNTWGVRPDWNVSKQTDIPKTKCFWDKFKIGTRVELKRDVDRWPSFGIVKKGKKGTVVANTRNEIYVKMDDYIDGAEEWNNCIIWYIDDFNEGMLGNEIDPMEEISKDLKIIGRISVVPGTKVKIKRLSASQLYDNSDGGVDDTIGSKGIVKELGSYNGRKTAFVRVIGESWWYFIDDLEVV
jgi:hypothetical protein